MNVPITSDLVGYQAFWTRVVIVLGCGFGVFAIGVLTLLYLIWKK